MNNRKDNRPFHDWIPRPLGVIVLLLMFVPPTFSGGAYMSNLNEMTGGLGVWTEDVQLAGFFTSIGMCLFPPFMIRFLQVRRIKRTYIGSFAILLGLNYICAVTTSIPLLLLTCLLIGFVRAMVMIHCTFTIAPYLTGMDTLSMFTMTEVPTPEVQYVMERKRTFLMPVLYFYILLIAQSSNVVTAWFAYEYQWQQVYYVVMGMLLIGILLVVLLLRDEAPKAPYHIEWELISDMLLMALVLCSMSYLLVYGKTLDWWNSVQIRWAMGILLLSIGMFFIVACRKRKRDYLPLTVFTYRNVSMAMLLFLLAMLLNSSNMFVGLFLKLSTPANNYHSAALSGWACLGCILGLILSLFLVVKKVRFRTAFLVGFLLMAAANVYMYFQYQSFTTMERLFLPMVLNYAGLLIPYALVAAWGMKHLPAHYLVTFVFLMIWMRNAIAPVIGTSVYTNWLNERQQFHTMRLAEKVSQTSIPASTLRLYMGKQATLLAMKDITGKTIWLLLGTSCLVMLLPYYKNETT